MQGRLLPGAVLAAAIGACGPVLAADLLPVQPAANAAADRQLSDAAINARVKSALKAEKGLGGLDIGVATSDGVVRLSGYTESSAQMSHAADLARQVSGVRSVSNELRLKTSPR